MTDEQTTKPYTRRHYVGVALVAGGVLILAALCGFVAVALNYRLSFTGSLPPFLDFAEAIAMLSPVILLALFLMGYGRRLLRKE